ncbi:MAG: hypothetical protein KBD78_03465 [Oligoflexales bacterium]|nr:hypothetical protein [Oligoflexales bacterium]
MLNAKFLFLLVISISNIQAISQINLESKKNDLIFQNRNSEAKIRDSVYLSLVWEGSHLKLENLESIKQFRADFPDMPIIHFIDPAYFTHSGSDEIKIQLLINSALKKEDRICLHNHSWNGLLQHSGVTPRYKTSYWGQKINTKLCESTACGHEVPITDYSKSELYKILQSSQQLFQKHFKLTSNCYMAGAWLMSKDLLDVLIAHNFKYDFSYTNLRLLQNRLKAFPLYQMIKTSWIKYELANTPRIIHRPLGWIFEIGVNAASLDYHSNDGLKSLFDLHLAASKAGKNLHPFHFSLYQESFHFHEKRLREFLRYIREKSGILPNRQEDLNYLDLTKQN